MPYFEDQTSPAPREGAFDAQLSFAGPLTEAPSPIPWIVKRDGREAQFNQRKIANAIFKAASAIGGDDRDRADNLASGVTIYLAKQLNGLMPTVDQVQDAVEKVLIEMGHARTALAYVRYRDKRDRLRKLRGGDVSAILDELDEARRQRDALEPIVQRPLFVRTSDERLAGWDGERIVQALVRETRMPEDDARRVALEVEGQVTRAELTTLTAALVRELVDAKLVELGLERYRARHMRLGVPLYDAEQIICTPNQGESEGQQDPAATDIALARRVKREFALSAVHSAEITDAHVRGIIHLHGLSEIDRIHSASHSLEFLKRFGLAMYSGRRFAPPPTTADALIAQASRFTVAMQRQFVESVRWRSFNESLSPFLHGESDIDRVARLALFGSMMRAGAPPPTSIELCWPQSNAAACAFATDFATIWGAAIDEGSAYGMPNIDVPVSAEALRITRFRALLATLMESHERRVRVTLTFDRSTPNATGLDWPARDVIGGMVTLNLPRAAYETRDEATLLALLAKRAHVAIEALAEKKSFLERLFAFGGAGPLSALAFRYGGNAYADPHEADYVLGVTGLNECAKFITGEELHRSPATVECTQHILRQLRQVAESYSSNKYFRVVIGADTSDACARRFATLDLQLHPDPARAATKNNSITRDATYTPGVSTSGPLTPIETIRIAGMLHSELDMPAATSVSLGDSEVSPATIVSLVEKALAQTACAEIRFVQ